MFLAKLRYGWAFIGEKVFVKNGYGPIGNRVIGEGRILKIGFNYNHKKLPHFPTTEVCLKIKWKTHYLYRDNEIVWETADWFFRHSNNITEKDEVIKSGIWSIR